jgi:hypothetical protein
VIKSECDKGKKIFGFDLLIETIIVISGDNEIKNIIINVFYKLYEIRLVFFVIFPNLINQPNFGFF